MNQNGRSNMNENSNIRNILKAAIDSAARESEQDNPLQSIAYECLGLQMADNSLEEVQKRCSIITKCFKMMERRQI